MAGLNISQFARSIGVSETVMRRAIKRGRVIVGPDGKIDPATQTQRWHDTRDPSKGGRPATVSTPERSASAAQSFDKLKTAKVAIEIQILQEELKKTKAETVNRDDVRRALTSFARLIRDKWTNFPNRYGQQMAAELGVDPATLMALLDRYVRLQLDEVANTKPTLPE